MNAIIFRIINIDDRVYVLADNTIYEISHDGAIITPINLSNNTHDNIYDICAVKDELYVIFDYSVHINIYDSYGIFKKVIARDNAGRLLYDNNKLYIFSDKKFEIFEIRQRNMTQYLKE